MRCLHAINISLLGSLVWGHVAGLLARREPKGLGPLELAGRRVPPLVTQIADGENGGIMMDEFPPSIWRS